MRKCFDAALVGPEVPWLVWNIRWEVTLHPGMHTFCRLHVSKVVTGFSLKKVPFWYFVSSFLLLHDFMCKPNYQNFIPQSKFHSYTHIVSIVSAEHTSTSSLPTQFSNWCQKRVPKRPRNGINIIDASQPPRPSRGPSTLREPAGAPIWSELERRKYNSLCSPKERLYTPYRTTP